MADIVRQTKDYSRFELLPYNRDVRKNKMLTELMSREGWISAYPMHVQANGNGTYKVKAGHHRFEVARALGLPVKYIICNDRASVYELERATTPWSLDDALNANIREGKHDYIVVKRYHEKTGIALSQCISMLAGQSAASTNKLRNFRSGEYHIAQDIQHAEDVADLVNYLKKLNVDFATNTYLVKALSKIQWVEEFKNSVLKKKLKSYLYLLERQPDIAMFLQSLECIYNRKNKNKIPLAFLANEKAKQRNAIKY